MEKMGFEEFKNMVVEEIINWLPEHFQGAKVELQTVVKNNSLKLTGLVILLDGSNIAPTIYLEEFYRKYQEGERMEIILNQIARLRVENEEKNFDISLILDLERCKHKIFPRIIGGRWNQEFLKDKPCVTIADLTVVFYLDLGEGNNGFMSVTIHDGILKTWKIGVEELYQISLENLERRNNGQFTPMGDMIREILLSEDFENEEKRESLGMMIPKEEVMFVLTNHQKLHGANLVLNKNLMRRVLQIFGEEFYLLPSSIHEWIVVRKMEGMSVESLREMVLDVNDSQVEPEERLGENVYTYSLEEGLKIA